MVEADVVVVGIGVIPNTGWLEGSGLTLDDGVVCDDTTLAAPGVVAGGDVARWPNPLVRRGRCGSSTGSTPSTWAPTPPAGCSPATVPGEPFAPVPWFWSDQYDRKIQLAGRVRPTDDDRAWSPARSRSAGSAPSTAATAGSSARSA